LESIAAQTLLPFELVIADDGSKDSTVDLIEDFARRSPFPVHFCRNERNLGSTKNFEQVISLCSGELIALSDQDDIWHTNKLSRLADAFVSNTEIGGVFSDARLVDSESKLIGKTLWQIFDFNRGLRKRWSQGQASRILIRRDVITGATFAFRSDLRNLILPISARWVHDGWIAWIVSLSSMLTFVEEPLIDYRVHSTQQEGVPGLTVTEALARTLRHRAADQAMVAAAFEDLRHHLACELKDRAVFDDLDAKISLCSARAKLPDGRVKRFLRAVLLVPDYMRYSRGLREAIKDVLLG
jgi:glycosyltransferase involved in cell wall biosynthesis